MDLSPVGLGTVAVMTLDIDDIEAMTPAEQAGVIKSKYSVVDIASQLLDLDLVSGNKIRSPFNGTENTPSCHLYEDGFYDFSTGRHGDIIDLYMAITGASWRTAVRRIFQGVTMLDAEDNTLFQRPSKPVVDLREVFETNRDSDWVFTDWALPAVPEQQIQRLHLANEIAVRGSEMFIAHWNHGAVNGIKVRAADGRKSAIPGSTFTTGLYNPMLTFEGPRTVAILLEGESDLWALDWHLTRHKLGHRFALFALPGGAGLWRDQWLTQLAGFETVYTAFDNDHAGKQATDKVSRAVGFGRWKELRLPGLFNDVRESLHKHWDPIPFLT